MENKPKRHYIEDFSGTVWDVIKCLNRKEIAKYVDSLPSFVDKIKETKPLIEGAIDFINEQSQEGYRYLYNSVKKHFIVAKSNGDHLESLLSIRSDACKETFIRYFQGTGNEEDLGRVKSLHNFLKQYRIKRSY